MDLDKFGEIIDDFLEQNHVCMMIDLHEGTIHPVIKDNVGLGSTIRFYILLNSLVAVCEEMKREVGIPDGYTEDWGKTLDGILNLVKGELLEV